MLNPTKLENPARLLRTAPDLFWLEQVRPEDRAQVGTKAGVLALLLQSGLPVPPGFCLAPSLGQDLAAGREQAWQRVRQAYGELLERGRRSGFPSQVAVRSSGVAEDGRLASYAGQYETVLDVAGEAPLRAAIEACLGSQHSSRALAYEDGRRASPGFAVLIQCQVPAEASGVLFTQNPLDGSHGQLLVEAGPGLGEGLVGGRVVPQVYRLDRASGAWTGPAPALLDPAHLADMAVLAERVEGILGPGLDIEWAVAGGRTWILQARPVVLSHPAAEPVPLSQVWTRANIGEVLPQVVTPLTLSVFERLLKTRAAGKSWEPAGADTEPGETAGLKVVRGRVYLRLEALLDSFCYLPGVTPLRLAQVLGVDLPASAGEYRRPGGLPVRLAQALFGLDLLGFFPRLSILAGRLPPLPEGPALDPLLDWLVGCFRVHLKATAYAVAACSLLAQALERWLPGEAPGMLVEILLGEEDLQSAVQGLSLWDLAEAVRTNPDLRRLVETQAEWELLARLAAGFPGGPGWLQAVQTFLAAHGARAVEEFELAQPRWREDPAFLLAAIRRYLLAGEQAGSPSARRDRRDATVARLREQLRPARRFVFNRLLGAAGRWSALRENQKFRLVEGFARLRSVLQAQGELLPSPGDIFFLELPEVRSLSWAGEKPSGGGQAGLADRAAQRRKTYDHWRRLPAAPDLVDGAGRALASPGLSLENLEGALVLSGVAASPGVAAGRARVLFDIAEASALQPGEILVTPHTDPGWTPLFLSCRAVVTEVGGFLSHGATIAREYGIPCVVNARGATRRIQTGDWVQVDGGSGHVLLEKGKS